MFASKIAAVDPTVWEGQRVLVTGHTGFKGVWLSSWLADMGAEVHGFALDSVTTPSLFSLVELETRVRHMVGDIRDADVVRAAIAAAAPDVVFHLAAQPLVRASYLDPLGTFSTNVLGTATVLEACRHAAGVRAVVCVTTDKCYENREWAWGYRELDPLGGHDPYSASKAAAEIVATSFRRAFGGTSKGMAHIATARAGNVIGGGDWSDDRLVPDAVRAFTTGRSLEVRKPLATRPWQHVLAPLSGYLVLAQALLASPDAADAWNFGPPDEDVVTVAEFLDRFVLAWGGDVQWQTIDAENGPHEAGLLKLDTSKARRALGWVPSWTLDNAVVATSRWYRTWHAGASGAELRTLMHDQTVAYMRATS